YGPNGQPISQQTPLDVRDQQLRDFLGSVHDEESDALKVALTGQLPPQDNPLPVNVVGETLTRITDAVSLNSLPAGDRVIGAVESDARYFGPYQQAIRDAWEIRANAGVPSHVHVGVSLDVVPGLTNPAILVDSPSISVGTGGRAVVESLAESGDGSLESPYLIRNRRFKHGSGTAFLWADNTADYHILFLNCEFLGEGTGINFSSPGNLTVQNCRFANPDGSNAYGIRLRKGGRGKLTVKDSTFDGCFIHGIRIEPDSLDYKNQIVEVINCRFTDSAAPWADDTYSAAVSSLTRLGPGNVIRVAHCEVSGGEGRPVIG